MSNQKNGDDVAVGFDRFTDVELNGLNRMFENHAANGTRIFVVFVLTVLRRRGQFTISAIAIARGQALKASDDRR